MKLMRCSSTLICCHMKSKTWWDNPRQRLEVAGTEITSVMFIAHFLNKYFIEDVHIKKEIETHGTPSFFAAKLTDR